MPENSNATDKNPASVSSGNSGQNPSFMRGSSPLGLLVGAPASGSGKTLLCLALSAALSRRGLKTQPFKIGPDTIDAGLHQALSGHPCLNLDGWLYSPETNREIFRNAALTPTPADFLLVEGVMGLFDGASTGRRPYIDTSSSAWAAKLLGLPVLLVVNAKAQGRTLAAWLKGLLAFDPELSFAGVIFNGVSSLQHKSLLGDIMAEHCPGLPIWGFLPHKPDLHIPERHLGLVTAEEGALSLKFKAELADFIESNVDIASLLASLPATALPASPGARVGRKAGIRLGVARDAAFSFICQENLRLLHTAGAEIVYFSPLAASELPGDIDALYLPGGYPELYAARLAENSALRGSIRKFHAEGRKIWAEGGGFLYLGETLTDMNGQSFPMCGLIEVSAYMAKRMQSMGYRQIVMHAPSLFGAEGCTLRGHEFHYSALNAPTPPCPPFTLTNSREQTLDAFIRADENIFASYLQLHLGSCPGAADHFVKASL